MNLRSCHMWARDSCKAKPIYPGSGLEASRPVHYFVLSLEACEPHPVFARVAFYTLFMADCNEDIGMSWRDKWRNNVSHGKEMLPPCLAIPNWATRTYSTTSRTPSVHNALLFSRSKLIHAPWWHESRRLIAVTNQYFSHLDTRQVADGRVRRKRCIFTCFEKRLGSNSCFPAELMETSKLSTGSSRSSCWES
ncbi:hypothetical protein VNO77_19249 [Canavalia gladiata]|uniref:Uncharacterized protein n=1 Tax=Canavalia gladiata TaxID=3824 RepID=A0AAN9QPF4_CANGL